jgi:hypothetical protein
MKLAIFCCILKCICSICTYFLGVDINWIGNVSNLLGYWEVYRDV